jgi:branched-subunit amino acid aminotransferase/4-amino-4-deoxychorismate lyase
VLLELDGNPIAPTDAIALGLTNFGHFTSMVVEDQRVKGLDLHLSRLAHDCDAVFGTPLDAEHVRQLVRHATAAVDRPVVVRVTVFDPQLEVGHPGGSVTPRVLVTSRPAPSVPPPPLNLRSVEYVRELAGVKHVGLFGPLHHRRRSQLAGYDDVLFTDPTGQISEGATWNICFFDGSVLHWPKAEHLPGVAMRLIRAISLPGKPSAEAPIDVPHAQAMRAAFATNAVVGVRPVRSIDDVELPGDPGLLAELREAYAAIPGTQL